MFAGPQLVQHVNGPIRETSNALDFALEERDHFFAVGLEDPGSGK